MRLAPTKDSKQQGLVLIDDIDPVTVEDLKDKGLAPAVVIETSYKNCQAWIRASKEPIERETATHLAKLLTREAGGDPGSASYQHYGRLAGFTNRKPDHQDMYTGRHPYVKLLSAYGTTAPEGEQWLAQAQSAAAIAREKQQEAAALRDQRGNREATEQEKEKALRAFESSYAHALRHYGTNKDYSARDWALTKNLAKLGYSQDALQYALRWGSPDLEKRKPGHEDDYVARTVAKVFEHPEVLQAIAEREARRKKREQENQRQQPLPLTQPTEKQNPTEPPFPSPTPTPSSSQAKEQTAVPEQSLTEDERQLIEAMKWLNDGKERGKQERRPEHHLPVRPPANDKQSYADRAEPATPMPDTGEKVSLDAEAEIVNTFPTPASSDQNPSSKGSAKVPVYWNSYYRWLQTQQIVRQPKPARIDPGTASAKRPPVPIKAEPVGDLDADSVAAIINAAHQSKNATQQLRTASWAYQNFNQDEGRWNKCKLEYFRELHRVHQAFGRDEALNPKTDIEIALKLRMAGFSVTQIYRTIQEASPVATSLPSQEHQFVYLKKAIQPYLQSSQTRTVANNFQYERERQAKRTITDPTQLQNHLAERRLEKLGLATPVSTQTQNPTPQQTRSPQPQPNHRPSPLPQHKRDDCEPER
ncbi:MAG: DNA-primase RepB domain-containing protein [Nostoc sp. ChiQUE01b]|nr:DNA-primase RepB domain-containing protein [Nostoc sp. ChiQUE01b]MDZ8260596.1 DNA-primase RepB domain-containing protein [Nostoc sp. ChiQUE01b]